MEKNLLVFICLIFSFALADRFALIVSPRTPYADYGVPSESCRLYNDLIKGGVNPDNIILMSSKVIANSNENPYPGQLFTDDSPDSPGIDYAKNCLEHIDYDENHFRGAFLLNLMTGDVEGVRKLTGIENPKVLKSGPDDEVLFYLTSHGMEEEIIVGDTRIVKDDFIWALHCMYDDEMYKHLLIFLETCFSGSMFKGLPTNENVYVITAADATHESYESHCPPDDVVDGKAIGACLSCLWDNAMEWFIEGDSTHTLDELFDHTHEVVSKESKQNVSKFGSEELGSMKIEEFTGPLNEYHKNSFSSSSSLIPHSQVDSHLAKWRVIRAENDKKEEELNHYKDIVYNDMKKEISVLRLGHLFLSEQELALSLTTTSEEYNISCVNELANQLVQRCYLSYPFSIRLLNVLRSICKPSFIMKSINYEDICI